MNLTEARNIASADGRVSMSLDEIHNISVKVTRARSALETAIALGRVHGIEQMYMTTLLECHQAACEALYGSDWRKCVNKTYGGL